MSVILERSSLICSAVVPILSICWRPMDPIGSFLFLVAQPFLPDIWLSTAASTHAQKLWSLYAVIPLKGLEWMLCCVLMFLKPPLVSNLTLEKKTECSVSDVWWLTSSPAILLRFVVGKLTFLISLESKSRTRRVVVSFRLCVCRCRLLSGVKKVVWLTRSKKAKEILVNRGREIAMKPLCIRFSV